MNRMYLDGDTNGAFIGNNGLTDNKDEAKVFKNIGDAMRACVQYNRNAYTFRVIPIG